MAGLMFRVLAIGCLTGCAQMPVGDVPAQTLAQCEEIANEYDRTQRVAERAAIAGAKGYGLGWAFKHYALVPNAARFGVTAFGAAGVFAGALEGLLETSDRKRNMLRECLRDRGHKAY